ncbi:hypothetical protein KCP78_08715 [Salmonella enterica subsp. enterica]|nr:hypothetical protein KCP78_08715 [Salmonella enterica subsp. enterica]
MGTLAGGPPPQAVAIILSAHSGRCRRKWPLFPPGFALTPAGFIFAADGVIRTAIAQPHRGGHANHP